MIVEVEFGPFFPPASRNVSDGHARRNAMRNAKVSQYRYYKERPAVPHLEPGLLVSNGDTRAGACVPFFRMDHGGGGDGAFSV